MLFHRIIVVMIVVVVEAMVVVVVREHLHKKRVFTFGHCLLHPTNLVNKFGQ